MSKRVQVYDRVNRERLLGTIDRYAMPSGHTHRNFALRPRDLGGVTMCMDPGSVNYVSPVQVKTVTLERVTKLSKDGWSAEVVVVTDASLSDLCALNDFRPALANYSDYDCGPGYPRAWYYNGTLC